MENRRFAPFRFRNGKTARNRIVVPPMASQTADGAGFATVSTQEHYRRLATAGAGLIFAEYSFVHASGRGEANQLGANSDDQIAGLAQISASIQASGALSGLQIVHVGAKSTTTLTEGELLGASAIPVEVKGQNLETPRSISQAEIEIMIGWYLRAAARAAKAGFDIVELHAAHGYGLNQWLSPLTNQRNDEFGGPIENRARLLLQVAAEIRESFPQLLLAVRLPAQDHLPGGLTTAEMVWVAQALEKQGVDLIDVSSGIGGWRRPDHRQGEGYLIEDAATLKAEISLPVIGVGGIESALYIEQILNDQKVDFAAVGRAILKDPGAFTPTKV